MYLIDTNIISEMRKIRHRKADPKLTAWVNSINPSLFYTSIVVMMELQRGVIDWHRTDPEQGKRLQQWLDISVKAIFDKRVYTSMTTLLMFMQVYMSPIQNQ